MRHKVRFMLLILPLLAACSGGVQVDAVRRSKVDGMNKEAFVNRYRDPALCIDLSNQALQYVSDSLPTYADGLLRALNNLAFAHYQLSQTDDALNAISRVERIKQGDNNSIEQAIAMLLHARLLQRDCRMADSYRLLYAVQQSGVLEANRGNLLYNYAQSEYYITLLTLNFHYRNGKEDDVRRIIEEVEHDRSWLPVDYAEDMALNYAIAYGYQSAGESLKALEYCDRNYDILDYGTYCPFHHANTLQMEAYILRTLPGTVPPDSVMALYLEACDRFWDYGDPYQVLGGITSSARYALMVSDTLLARRLLADWMESASDWRPFSAPKMELSLFDLLIRSRASSNPADLRRWYEHHSDLRDYIAAGEREDFVLQTTLADERARSTSLRWFAISLAVLTSLLALLAVLLWVATRRLRREKRLLQEANRRDVERIANVEATLSVLRHDVSPFMGYLRNPDLPEELRSEVVDQLVRTFDNIKQWTRLSAPAGLAFNASRFALQEAFDEVARQHIPLPQGVRLEVQPTALSLWADRLLLVVLLRNLVNNALQHTAEGYVRVEAHEVEGSMVDILVSDTGCGMTAEQLASLFKADRPSSDGHGFGLLLCRYITAKHDDHTRRGCRLYAESTPNQGTTMHCLLAQA